nr:MAG TPA: hypothetical protein [Caudoviricetes sp.]
MGKYFELTDEIMQKATAYMPIEDKAELAKTIAEQCVVDIPTAEQNLIGEKFLALPYIKGENRELKALCLMNVLLSHYLKIPVNSPLNEEKYNHYAEGSILNQIERYKSNFDLKNKAFDLLADYKEFRKFVDVEINNLIALNNDPLARLTASIQVFATPENIKKAVDELKKAGEDYTKFLKEKQILPETDKTVEQKKAEENKQTGDIEYAC